MKFISAKQQAANNEAERDKLFRKKYPAGRFALAFLKAVTVCGHTYPDSYTLHWKRGRRTGPDCGVRTYFGEVLLDAYWYNDDSGVAGRPICRFYDNLPALLAEAKRREFPDALIDAFVKQLEEKQSCDQSKHIASSGTRNRTSYLKPDTRKAGIPSRRGTTAFMACIGKARGEPKA